MGGIWLVACVSEASIFYLRVEFKNKAGHLILWLYNIYICLAILPLSNHLRKLVHQLGHIWEQIDSSYFSSSNTDIIHAHHHKRIVRWFQLSVITWKRCSYKNSRNCRSKRLKKIHNDCREDKDVKIWDIVWCQENADLWTFTFVLHLLYHRSLGQERLLCMITPNSVCLL